MLPKDKSATTLLKSGSSSSSKSRIEPNTAIQFLKGVGPKLSFLLNQKGISTASDAAFYFPRDYQDRSKIHLISELQPEMQALIKGQIIGFGFIPMRRLKRPMFEARIRDEKQNVLSLKWFHYNRSYFETKFKDQPTVLVYGTVKEWSGRLSILHPEIDFNIDEFDDASLKRIYPVYSESEGLNQKAIQKIVAQAVEAVAPQIADDIPEVIRHQYQLPDLRHTIQFLHNPSIQTPLAALQNHETAEQKRMIFDEFFKFEWVVGKKRLHLRQEETESFTIQSTSLLFEEFSKRIPFKLTEDQMLSIEKIFEDLSSTKPMSRLLQGDVGCGKTLVCLAAILPVANAHGQSVLMAPTEILAKQHFFNAQKYLEGLSLSDERKLHVECLTGATTKKQKLLLVEQLKAGQIDLLVGTHALIEDDVEFKKLGLIVVDEQHRFGVDQRLKLRKKGKSPHCLLATATPIPRTLALTAYGDLDVSTIKQLPKGRPEIHTKVIKPDERKELYSLIEEQLKQGRQAYVIYPLVEESEKMDLADAVSGAETLKNGPFQKHQVGLLHGRMSNNEKNEIMNKFKEGKLHVLVSTTVVEVGVDVPNSTVLVIENAERFGLSQLHQLRGRIGRGIHTSYCFLVTKSSTPVAFERLSAMEQTRDGFKLAELDLQIRGPGDFLGTRQSGDLQFKYANLVRDQQILQQARTAAFDLLQKDPELVAPEHRLLRQYMQRKGHLQQERFETA